MKDIFEIISGWSDDLIWCPSQCYLKIKYKERHFVIYLRWRHCDPWSATLIECPPDGRFNMHHDDFKWIELEIMDWEDTELDRAKENAISLVNEKLKYESITAG